MEGSRLCEVDDLACSIVLAKLVGGTPRTWTGGINLDPPTFDLAGLAKMMDEGKVDVTNAGHVVYMWYVVVDFQ